MLSFLSHIITPIYIFYQLTITLTLYHGAYQDSLIGQVTQVGVRMMVSQERIQVNIIWKGVWSKITEDGGKSSMHAITHWNLSIQQVIPATFEEYSKGKKCKHGQKIWDTYELEANFEKDYSKLCLKLTLSGVIFTDQETIT